MSDRGDLCAFPLSDVFLAGSKIIKTRFRRRCASVHGENRWKGGIIFSRMWRMKICSRFSLVQGATVI